MKVVVDLRLEVPHETHLDPERLENALKDDCIQDILELHKMHLCTFVKKFSVRLPHEEDGWLFDTLEGGGDEK
jgi:hypothetical protein